MKTVAGLFFLLASLAMTTPAAAEGIRLSADAVESVIVSYLWTGYAPKSMESELLIVHKIDGQWTDLHTGHLVAAMAWMDREGLRVRLQKLGKSAKAPDAIRRHVKGLIELLAKEPDLPESITTSQDEFR